MITIDRPSHESEQVRDYRTACRKIRKNKLTANVVWTDDKTLNMEFAVAFQDGIRKSSCFLSER